MPSDRQGGIMETFLSMLSAGERLIYEPIMSCLSELGYKPQKQSTQGYVISYKHPLHNKQIAKIGIRGKKPAAFFALRFSACSGYSQKFSNAVHEAILTGERYIPMCDTCKICKGGKHVYTYELPSGETASRCGAYAYEIPNVSMDDVDEIKRLLREQHEYFIRYSA
jgi:hypothetical protein